MILNTVTLRVLVVGASQLLAKDRCGTSDPFAVLKMGSQRHQTEVILKSLNPVWNASFDFVIDGNSPLPLEIKVWDKDYVGRDFLGNLVVNVSDFVLGGSGRRALIWDDASNVQQSYLLVGGEGGEITLRMGIVGTDIADSIDALRLSDNIASTSSSMQSLVEANDTVSIGSTDGDLQAVEFNNSSPEAPRVAGVLEVVVVNAKNLPKGNTVLATMDPFVVISYAKNTYRTRHCRRTLNPTFDERLFLHVQNQDTDSNFMLNFSVYDHDRFSNHDHVGRVALPIQALVQECINAECIQADGIKVVTQALADMAAPSEPVIREYVEKELTLVLKDGVVSVNSSIFLKFRYTTNDELRRNFWHALARIYDADENGLINIIEFRTLLDNLGSTLSDATINGFFQQLGKSLQDELSIDELINVLQSRMQKDVNTYLARLRDSTAKGAKKKILSDDDEKVLVFKECPFCHKPSLKNKNQIDILTHMSICCSEDLSQVDNFVMGGFLTEAHAQRKWFTKVLTTLSFGGYEVGRNNANILVQDRATGQLVEEKMPTYIRLGIRAMYQSLGSKKAVDTRMVQNMLKKMSMKQGKKFDDPKSVREIKPFINFHRLPIEEIRDPLESFKNFNEFFYRKLKLESRPTSSPDDPNVLVSPADCRLNCFKSITAATDLWIKGRQFSIANLLQDQEMAKLFDGGNLGIFRLAPQDYHRFHMPVDGIVGPTKAIEGAFYTVNPMAIRSAVDVYCENVRSVTYIDSPQFGKVAYVSVGAMMVGSIVITATKGQSLKRNDEFGYFQFGGSTVLLIFQKGAVEFDRDLLDNSEQHLETLVKVGTRIGVHS